MWRKQGIKSIQEQAVASWINYLNQTRLNYLMESLTTEQCYLKEATTTIDKTFEIIRRDIVNNGKGRGGTKGMHGFIAEVAQCGIGNARKQIEGEGPIYEWINDNGPADLKKGTQLIQQKFVQSGNHLSLQAISKHWECYPHFLEDGGIYQIPSDHYEKIKWLLSIPQKKANQIAASTGEFSLKQWKEVQDFFKYGEVPFEKIEPSDLRYGAIQCGAYERTLNDEKITLKNRNRERTNNAYQKSKPSFKENAKATAVSAAIEGGMEFCMALCRKCKSGKKFTDLDENDWKEIVGDSSVAFEKGAVRGTSIYLLTNYTATPAAVANAIMTTAFGIAEQAYLFKNKKIDELSLIENSELLCMDASVSALSAFAGQVLIPIPVLGAVIGNAVGTVMYQVAKDYLSGRTQIILKEYAKSLFHLEQSLQKEYREYVRILSKDMKEFIHLINQAFVLDIRIAFEGSISLAKACGVPSGEILSSSDEIRRYFTD